MKRKKVIQKIMSGILVAMLAVMFSLIVNSSFVNAEDRNSQSEHEKYYKSIAIEYGDTLWGIAVEYKGVHYESVYDYIDEVMQINNLITDRIHAGQYLTVPYFNKCNCDDYCVGSNTEKRPKIDSSIK